jgi:hypothetical protein
MSTTVEVGDKAGTVGVTGGTPTGTGAARYAIRLFKRAISGAVRELSMKFTSQTIMSVPLGADERDPGPKTIAPP